jgi:hypothetical protein
MKETASTYRTIAIETCLAAAACACVGLIVFGSDILSIYHHKFVFIAEGLTGAFTFYSLRRLRARNTLIFLLVLFFFQAVLLTKSFTYGRAFMDFIFFAAVPIAVAVFFWSYRKHLNQVRLYDPLILGAFVVATIAVARTILVLKMTINGLPDVWPPSPGPLLNEAFESFLIGAGLGVGFWILDLEKVKAALHLSKGFTKRAAQPAPAHDAT